jgi:hypothetical protein
MGAMPPASRRPPVPAPDTRSEALLLANLSDVQRREYLDRGTITVVKDGVIRGTLARYGAAAFLIGVLAVVGRTAPHLEAAAVLAAIAFIVALSSFLVWLPPLAIACTRRRVWILGADRRPTLVVHGRRIPFCVRVEADLPEADRVLAFKNAIEGNERYFLRRANALV